MAEKLIIWDFDGVVSDTEKLWLDIELEALNRYLGLNWDFETINKYLAGQGYAMQLKVLAGLGIVAPEKMWEEIGQASLQRILAGLERTPGIEKVLELPGFQNAMATGGMFDETLLKLRSVGLDGVFGPLNLVTIDMVKNGKPEPDSFLLAAEKMGFAPKDCIVIEDSIAGLTAAIKARMLPICFVGSEMYRHNKAHLEKVKALGVEYVFETMEEIKNFLAAMIEA